MKRKKRTIKKEWWQTSFNQDYLNTYVDTTPESVTNQQVSFLVQALRPIAKKKILDLGCGYGRHSLKLARAGGHVTGFDYSKFFLAIAKKQAKRQGIKARFVFGDMRKLPFKQEFDAVVCLFTSFGYFRTYQEHEVAIQGVNRALKPRGVFLLDLNNPARRLGALMENGKLDRKRAVMTSKKILKLSNGLNVTITQELDVATMRYKLNRQWRAGKKQKVSLSDIQLFTLPEITYLLERNGFAVEKTLGDFDGSAYSPTSRRLIVWAEKTNK